MINHLKPINWIQWITLFTALIVSVTLPVIVLELRIQSQHRNDAVRAFICYFEQAVFAQPQTPHQKQVARNFFKNALAKIDAKPCSSN